MKLAGLICAAAALGMMGGVANAATNLIVNGDFSNPNEGGGWGTTTSLGGGWKTNDPYGVFEVGNSSIYGLPCISAPVCQNLEVNANAIDTVTYDATGLTPGASYNLVWYYGGRNSGGPQQLDVSAGGPTVIDTSNGVTSVWTRNYLSVVADSGGDATISFASLGVGGSPSFGNELANVSLTAVPEPATWAMMLFGIGGLGVALRSRRKVARAPIAA